MRIAEPGGGDSDLQLGSGRAVDGKTADLEIGRAPVAGTALGMVLLALSAPWLTVHHPAAALAIRGFFSGLCHQIPARSFFIGASPLAICVRCLGIYSGVAAGAVLNGWLRWPRGMALRCFFAGLLLNAADVAAETLRLHGNLPIARLLFGGLLGIATGILLTLPRVNPRQDDSAAFHPQTG